FNNILDDVEMRFGNDADYVIGFETAVNGLEIYSATSGALLIINNTQTNFNPGGNDINFQIASVTDTSCFFLDGEGAGKIGIGVGCPTEKLDVNGNIKTNGELTDGTNAVTPLALKYKDIDFSAGEFNFPSAVDIAQITELDALAPLNDVTGTNKNKLGYLMDATADEGIKQQLKIPKNVDTAGTVTFEALVYSGAANPDGDVILSIYHSAGAVGESFDIAYTEKMSAATDIDTPAQYEVVLVTWTETIA
ncbi:unnamed protein product, partial [marine sediment metagenome]